MITSNERVVKSKSPTSPWVIEGLKENGQRKRLFFKTKEEADTELRRVQIKIRREGEEALQLPDSVRIDALRLWEKLEPLGKTIDEAGEWYLNHLAEIQKSTTVGVVVDEYLAMQKGLKWSPVYLKNIESRLTYFRKEFETVLVCNIRSKDIQKWLSAISESVKPITLNGYRQMISSFFAYAVKVGYLDSSRNPIGAIPTMTVACEPPEIFTVDELRFILENAEEDMIPVFTIGAFAGVRMFEILRLDWSDINFQRGYIHIPAKKSKTSARRLIVMSDNLRAWIAPYAAREGKIYDKGAYWTLTHQNEKARKAAGMDKWPKNGLRHSFCSYHLAKYMDAARLALDMGHTTTNLIFTNYREIVTPEEAERYWKIFPEKEEKNVILMSGAHA